MCFIAPANAALICRSLHTPALSATSPIAAFQRAGEGAHARDTLPLPRTGVQVGYLDQRNK